jgi:hypothetical protein
VWCGLDGFDTPALVYGDIDDDGTLLHTLEIFPAEEMRGSRAGKEHGSDDQVCPGRRVQNIVTIGIPGIAVGG